MTVMLDNDWGGLIATEIKVRWEGHLFDHLPRRPECHASAMWPLWLLHVDRSIRTRIRPPFEVRVQSQPRLRT